MPTAKTVKKGENIYLVVSKDNQVEEVPDGGTWISYFIRFTTKSTRTIKRCLKIYMWVITFACVRISVAINSNAFSAHSD